MNKSFQWFVIVTLITIVSQLSYISISVYNTTNPPSIAEQFKKLGE